MNELRLTNTLTRILQSFMQIKILQNRCVAFTELVDFEWKVCLFLLFVQCL